MGEDTKGDEQKNKKMSDNEWETLLCCVRAKGARTKIHIYREILYLCICIYYLCCCCCSHINSLTKESVVRQRCWSPRKIRKKKKSKIWLPQNTRDVFISSLDNDGFLVNKPMLVAKFG